jgi:pimeloyl-ACP methyl ester carboxylesterase
MTSFFVERDGAVLQGADAGTGFPVVFQHGLLGGEAQVAEILPQTPHRRRLTLECRGHGGSEAGSVRPFSIAMFAEDVIAACRAQGVEQCILGGVSMGAAIAMRMAALHPAMVRGLILARPAWLFDKAPANLQPYREIARLLRRLPPSRAKNHFAAGTTARALSRFGPENLQPLLAFFDRSDPSLTVDLLEQITCDGPGVGRSDAERLAKPVLVLGHAQDDLHPLPLAQQLADVFPLARFVELPPKAADKRMHVDRLRSAIAEFCAEHGA